MVNKELLARQLHLGMETFASVYASRRIEADQLGNILAKFDIPLDTFWLIIREYMDPANCRCVGEFRVGDVVYTKSDSKLHLAWCFIPNAYGSLFSPYPVDIITDIECDKAKMVFRDLLNLVALP